MLKSIIDTKYLPESEKNRLTNEMEVIFLRLKGVADLHRKVLELSNENQTRIDFQGPLLYFQQTLELSSGSQQNISQIDLQLIKQIIEEQDKIKALRYLKEISSHTTVFLGEIVKIFN